MTFYHNLKNIVYVAGLVFTTASCNSKTSREYNKKTDGVEVVTVRNELGVMMSLYEHKTGSTNLVDKIVETTLGLTGTLVTELNRNKDYEKNKRRFDNADKVFLEGRESNPNN